MQTTLPTFKVPPSPSPTDGPAWWCFAFKKPELAGSSYCHGLLGAWLGDRWADHLVQEGGINYGGEMWRDWLFGNLSYPVSLGFCRIKTLQTGIDIVSLNIATSQSLVQTWNLKRPHWTWFPQDSWGSSPSLIQTALQRGFFWASTHPTGRDQSRVWRLLNNEGPVATFLRSELCRCRN